MWLKNYFAHLHGAHPLLHPADVEEEPRPRGLGLNVLLIISAAMPVTAVTWRERSLEMLYMAPARRQAFTELLAICGERISRSA